MLNIRHIDFFDKKNANSSTKNVTICIDYQYNGSDKVQTKKI